MQPKTIKIKTMVVAPCNVTYMINSLLHKPDMITGLKQSVETLPQFLDLTFGLGRAEQSCTMY